MHSPPHPLFLSHVDLLLSLFPLPLMLSLHPLLSQTGSFFWTMWYISLLLFWTFFLHLLPFLTCLLSQAPTQWFIYKHNKWADGLWGDCLHEERIKCCHAAAHTHQVNSSSCKCIIIHHCLWICMPLNSLERGGWLDLDKMIFVNLVHWFGATSVTSSFLDSKICKHFFDIQSSRTLAEL